MLHVYVSGKWKSRVRSPLANTRSRQGRAEMSTMAHSRWDVQRDSYDSFVISSSVLTDHCIFKHCQTVLVCVWWAEPRLPQESLRQKAERIEELEEALRESVQITAEREMVLAQEEAARTHQEKQVNTTRLTISESTCDSLTIRCISKNYEMPP